MFSFLTTFSTYIGKAFGRPPTAHQATASILLEDEILKAQATKAFIFSQNKKDVDLVRF